MARGSPTFFKVTLPTVGSGQRLNFLNSIKSNIQTYLSNGSIAWETFHDLTGTLGGSFDEVLRSLGDRSLGTATKRGDADLFQRIRLHTDNYIYLDSFQDFATASETANRFAASNLADGSTPITTTTNLLLLPSDVNQIDYVMVVNEYEVAIILTQSGSYWLIWFGSPKRTHISPSRQGIARPTASYSSGSNVVVNLDRDISSSIIAHATLGQFVWAYDLTVPAGALAAIQPEFTRVTAVTSSSITLATVANNHTITANNGLIGADPCPMGCTFSTGTLVGTIDFTNRLDNSALQNNNQCTGFRVDAGMTEANLDPGTMDQYVGVSTRLEMDDGPLEFRGGLEHLSWWTLGTQSDFDRMLVNDDALLARAIFPSLVQTNWGMAIGPKAT